VILDADENPMSGAVVLCAIARARTANHQVLTADREGRFA
jgi:hypothetical protein